MPKGFFVFVAVAVVYGTAFAPAKADTQVGLQAFALTGTHFEPKGNTAGTGFGGFIRLDQRWRSMQLHFEGIPSIGTALVNTPTGPVHATLGLFAASARFRLDRLGRFWAGVGTETIAQQTPQAGLYKVDSSRLAGSRFEFVTSIPTATDRFVETQIAVMPHLSGTVYETRASPSTIPYSVTGAETASMIDLSAAYGIHHGSFDYLIGLRAINFAAKFASGREADRNVGAGLSAEVRLHI